MSAVELNDVVKRYGALEVVHSIDLSVVQGEFVVLVGPSGCGKSTTLRMVAGLEDISGGTISIGGRVVNRMAPKDRDVAMVFQNYALYPHLNVAENIAFGLRVRGEKNAVVEAAVSEAATILDLTPYLKRKPADLSGGQRQRVAMGRAIVRKPRVFLFDEPLSNLDAKLRTQMRAEIRRLHNRMGVTSIYVTHDQVEAMTLADRIVVMNSGRVEQVGSPMELFLNPANAFVASFLGSPPMNLLKATVTAANGVAVARIDGTDDNPAQLTLPAWSAAALDAGQRILVGLRPEHLEIETGTVADVQNIPTTVDLVEPLGSEALLHCRIAGQPVVAKVDTPSDVQKLAEIRQLLMPTDRLHIFDLETGRAVNGRS
ncbi:ABC transporter ATP-binding protein [Neorhizobium galegae]|uniref:Sn-glycerol-3-phosphate transport ATP-binding protein n=1 Tax=Neorhizobium galegae bv. orientalis str. HAMBI 540 TaxID=1028800 RepID=A0A068SZ55_NEOGA|nr:sn-glycerol-3-phosphate ABC transporter ATP-binding protein UgpC [Neorhizobium galegae]CDN51111.1 Sn-glycerol-3-phosphate transport ATP-binding protein [Neorhizobium galegae bv. orientalis str. HAMBI 540]CDZ44220.1 ATPase component of ABC-type sugar transporter [Neorhizobium galegae bv. orientalis]